MSEGGGFTAFDRAMLGTGMSPDELAEVLEQATQYIKAATQYIKALEIACLTFYRAIDYQAVNIIREDFPEVMEFVVDLHQRLEH